jgi:hypothetical protein
VRRRLAASLVALSCAPAANAQVATDAARRALIAEATTASRAGDHARAIELATRAATLRATPSLRYFLAREHLAAGHPVEALSMAGECAAGARADRDVNNREALLGRCEAIAAEADRGVARLTVGVAAPAPEGLRVTVGGALLAPALYDVPVPMAPGRVEVRASAPGHDPLEESLTLDAGARHALTVALRETPPPPPPIEPAALVAPSPPTVAARPDHGANVTAGQWVLLGVGAAGLAAGGVLGALALGARSDRDAACPTASRCDLAEAARLDARYRDEALAANVALGVGGVAVLAAVTWWVVARLPPRPRGRVALSPGALTIRW